MHGRGAVDKEHELLVARVAELEDRADFDDDDAAAFDDVALWRIPEIHRERAVEHDEDLLLCEILVTSAARIRRVAPDVRARLAERVGKRGDRPRIVVPARHPLDLGLAKDRVAHAGSIA